MSKKNNDIKNNENLDLTMQQKFDFESNSFDEEDTKVLYKKSRRKKYEKTKREKQLILLKNKYKKKYHLYMYVTVLLTLLVLILVLLYIFVKPKEIIKEKEVIKKVNVVPENIVFLGDSITDFYDLDKYYSDEFNVVNSGVNGDATSNILNDINNRVYIYNPSKIILLIGTNDIYYGKKDEEILENINKIVEGINKNRPLAEIYIESVYPTNNTNLGKINHSQLKNRNNERINNFNKKLEKYCKEKSISYININSKLVDENGDLDEEYTTDGLHLSDAGYELVTPILKKYLNK